MSLEVQTMTITGLAEQIIRDNVVNPDTNLGSRALTELQKPFRGQTLSRAQAAFREATAAGETGLPNFTIDDDVIAWYLNREGYKSATVRANEIRLVQIANEIQSRTGERNRKQANLDAQSASATPAMIAALQAEIDAIDAAIDALEAEQAEIEQ